MRHPLSSESVVDSGIIVEKSSIKSGRYRQRPRPTNHVEEKWGAKFAQQVLFSVAMSQSQKIHQLLCDFNLRACDSPVGPVLPPTTSSIPIHFVTNPGNPNF